jgi:ATP-binding protein involved in chromosome partitioning
MPLRMYGEKSALPFVIGIAAGKGGVGKSTLTALLGLALRHLGYKVGILDADLYGPSLRRMLPEERMPEQRGQKLTPAISQGISYISMAFFRQQGQASVVRAPIANGLISQFLQQVEWGELDFLLIDFPPGTGDIQITLAQQAHLAAALLITTPQEIALMDVRKCLHMFQQVNIPLLGVVENMSYFQQSTEGEKIYIFGKGGGERLARESGTPLLGMIPIDPLICQTLDQVISLLKINSPKLQEVFLTLANRVLIQIEGIKAEQASGVGSFELIWKLNLPPNKAVEAATEQNQHKQNATNNTFISSIWQKDNNTFCVRWADGTLANYQLAELQAHCPCAGCVDEVTGVRKAVLPSISKEIGAKKVCSVGRYAIKIEFESGCSHGIYDFALLRSIKGLSS